MAATLGLVSGFVGPAIEIGKLVMGPIKRQLNYLCCFHSNVQNLREEVKSLDDVKVGLKGRVDAATWNNQDPDPQVLTWLQKVDDIQGEMGGIESEIQNVKSGILGIKSRYSVSRRVKKMGEAMKDLRGQGEFGQISHPAQPASMESNPSRETYYQFESRKDIEEKIMMSMRENRVKTMGICGMGGVGKTTMAKKIMSRAKEEGLFDEVMMVVVSQPVDMLRIQKDIAELLGLDLQFYQSLQARAYQLSVRLKRCKRVLIILDDLWESLKLEDLGISDDCTVVLTTRKSSVLTTMKVLNIGMQQLLEKETRFLFKQTVGSCADDPSLIPVARDILKECSGLPIALVAVGEALKEKRDKSIWEDALQQLRSSNPVDMPSVIEKVYNPIKLSYDLLESEHARSIFLLCCIFLEDEDISVLYLTFYAWGLRMLEGIRTLYDARNRVHSLVEMLKARSLLMDGSTSSGGGYAKMHDVVRDVAIFIASRKGLIETSNTKDCTWMSSFFHKDDHELLPGSTFPNLRLLLIQSYLVVCADCGRKMIKMIDEKSMISFFSLTRTLNVFFIKFSDLGRSLPHTMQFSSNLHTLILHECGDLEDISVVGELLSLEILYCTHCSSIKELPIELRRLKQLKFLEFSNCDALESIPAGVISRLTSLEELTFFRSFKKWENDNKRTAALSELNSLYNLRRLYVEIEDPRVAEDHNISLPSNVEEFQVHVGPYPDLIITNEKKYERRELVVVLGGDITPVNWIHQLMRRSEVLLLKGKGSNKLVPLLPQCVNLRSLRMEELNISTGSNRLVNGELEVLRLRNIEALQEIYNVPNSFSLNFSMNLKTLILDSMAQVQHFVSLSEKGGHISFPKLSALCMWDLPRLTTLCKGVKSIEFPTLTSMVVHNCPNLKTLVSDDNKLCPASHDHDSLHLFCESKVAFGTLNRLNISSQTSRLWCDQTPMDFFTALHELLVSDSGNLNNLFSAPVATNLINLKRLRIESCSEMVNVIEEEEVETSSQYVFIKLETLYLYDLPKLNVFCDQRCAYIHLPSLRQVEINNCPKMERFSFGTPNTPNLKVIKLNEKTVTNTKDLNQALMRILKTTT